MLFKNLYLTVVSTYMATFPVKKSQSNLLSLFSLYFPTFGVLLHGFGFDCLQVF